VIEIARTGGVQRWAEVNAVSTTEGRTGVARPGAAGYLAGRTAPAMPPLDRMFIDLTCPRSAP
jgi:hypothetical protein